MSLKKLYQKHKKVMIFLIILLIIIVALIITRGEELESKDLDGFANHLDREVPDLLAKYDIAGANIALIEDASLAWVGNYGYANREQRSPMSRDTIFRAESISKSLTAWAVMNLVEQGELSLDDPVEKYLSRWELGAGEFTSQDITIRRLLNHTSGLPFGIYSDFTVEESLPSLEDSLSGAAGAPPARPIKKPGSTFLYSNPGYGLLELLIEEVTGQDYADYMKEEILLPLGMKNSTFSWSEELKTEMATGYDLDNKSISPYREPVKAHGELHTTIEDLARFNLAGMFSEDESLARKVLEVESLRQMYNLEVETTGFYALASEGYGLGYLIEELSDSGPKAVFHGGEGTGFSSLNYKLPESRNGIVILVNDKSSWLFLADILGDWGKWQGVDSIGISQIFKLATYIIWSLIILLVFISLKQLWQLKNDLGSGKREFALLVRKELLLRLLKAGVAITLVLFWLIFAQDLLISFLPTLANKLNLAIWLFLFASLSSALFIKKKGER